MKIIVYSMLFLLICGLSAIGAEFKLPRDVYPVKDFQKAQADAKAKRKFIAVVLSNIESKNEDTIKVTKNLFSRLKRDAVVVYAVKGDIKQLPELIQKALKPDKGPRACPSTVIVDENIREIVAKSLVPAEHNKFLRDAKKKMAETRRRLFSNQAIMSSTTSVEPAGQTTSTNTSIEEPTPEAVE